MDIINKINSLINESKQFEIGSWITQKRPDDTVYGIVVEIQKNGGAKALIIDWRGRPIFKSTKNWYPEAKQISIKDVPKKELDKIKKILKQSKYGSDINI